MAFNLTLSHEQANAIGKLLHTLPHVVLNNDKKSGIIVNPVTGGIIKFSRSEHNVLDCTVIDAKGLTEDQIKTAIQSDLSKLF